MKISEVLKSPSIKILLFLYDKGKVRYSDLVDLVKSRGTLSLNLKDLDEDKLIERKIVATKPIQAYYSLTEKGREIAKRVNEIMTVLSATKR